MFFGMDFDSICDRLVYTRKALFRPLMPKDDRVNPLFKLRVEAAYEFGRDDLPV